MLDYKIRNYYRNVYGIFQTRCDPTAWPDGNVLASWLVIGKEKAAVIDSMQGFDGKLREICEMLTDLPLICLLTHGHSDHTGGASLFDKVYMNKRDDDFLVGDVTMDWMEQRVGTQSVLNHWQSASGTSLLQYVRENAHLKQSFSYENIEDGDVVDLGGTQLQVIAVPGHTPGSVCFYDKDNNCSFTGDGVNPQAMFHTSSTATVKDYYEGSKHFADLVPENAALLSGHHTAPRTMQVNTDTVIACRQVLNGETDRDVPAKPLFPGQEGDLEKNQMMEHYYGRVKLTYSALRIR